MPTGLMKPKVLRTDETVPVCVWGCAGAVLEPSDMREGTETRDEVVQTQSEGTGTPSARGVIDAALTQRRGGWSSRRPLLAAS